MTNQVRFIGFGMRSDFLLKGLFLSALLFILSHVFFGQHVLLLMKEETGELVVLRKKQIADILTLSHEYLGDATGISKEGLMTQRKIIPIDSVHSLIVKHGNFGNKLGFPFKVAGSGVALVGGLVMFASKDTSTDTFRNEQDDTNLSQLIGGVALVGLGGGIFYLGEKTGDRKIEKEKTTYYLHQWRVKVTERKNIKRFKKALKK